MEQYTRVLTRVQFFRETQLYSDRDILVLLCLTVAGTIVCLAGLFCCTCCLQCVFSRVW